MDDNIDECILNIVAKIRSDFYTAKKLAALRKINFKTLEHEILDGFIEDLKLNSQYDKEHWALIINGVALMTPNAHNIKIPVGYALYYGDDHGRDKPFISEMQFEQLINATGDLKHSSLRKIFRLMSAVEQPFNWIEMAKWILHDKKQSIHESYYVELKKKLGE